MSVSDSSARHAETLVYFPDCTIGATVRLPWFGRRWGWRGTSQGCTRDSDTGRVLSCVARTQSPLHRRIYVLIVGRPVAALDIRPLSVQKTQIYFCVVRFD